MSERTMAMHSTNYYTINLNKLSPLMCLVVELFLNRRYSSALRIVEKRIETEEDFNSVNILKLMSALIQIALKDYESAVVILDEISDVIEPDRAKEICQMAMQTCNKKLFE